MSEPTPRSIWRNPIHFMAFGLGSGAMPRAPGTWGTVMAIPLYLLLAPLPPLGYAIAVMVLLLLGIVLCEVTSNDIGVDDHSGIVWDEFVGYWLTMWAVPFGWGWMLLGFIAFRVFDIWKPWPISWLDKNVKGGLGVMLDDVAAAVPAWLVLQICIYFFR